MTPRGIIRADFFDTRAMVVVAPLIDFKSFIPGLKTRARWLVWPDRCISLASARADGRIVLVFATRNRNGMAFGGFAMIALILAAQIQTGPLSLAQLKYGETISNLYYDAHVAYKAEICGLPANETLARLQFGLMRKEYEVVHRGILTDKQARQEQGIISHAELSRVRSESCSQISNAFPTAYQDSLAYPTIDVPGGP